MDYASRSAPRLGLTRNRVRTSFAREGLEAILAHQAQERSTVCKRRTWSRSFAQSLRRAVSAGAWGFWRIGSWSSSAPRAPKTNACIPGPRRTLR